jgi:ABC-type nitrate/sulfonate/bicarbonate transport system substrate-binding protein
MQRIVYRAVLLLMAIFFLSNFPVTAGATTQRVPIVYSAFSGGYLPLWLAAELGLGKKYGLELDLIYAGRLKPGQILLSGQTQFMFNTGGGTVESHVNGHKDFVILATMFDNLGGSIISRQEISRPQDLRGKILGVGRLGSITDILGRYILRKKLGLEPDAAVKVLAIGEPSSILPALERGVIHAAVLNMPFRFIAKKMGFRELVDMDTLGVEYPNAGLATLRSHIRKNPGQITNVLKSLVHAIHILKTDRQRSLTVMKKYMKGTEDDILDDTYNYFSRNIRSIPYPSLGGINTMLEILSQQYPAASTLNPHEVIDPTFLKTIQNSRFLSQLSK